VSEQGAVTVEGWAPVRASVGASLLEVCEAANIPMDSACGGFAACNSCRVDVLAGADRLTAQVPDEEAFLDAPDQRLGCQARIAAPGEVRVRLAPGV
jgi:ferredoxin